MTGKVLKILIAVLLGSLTKTIAQPQGWEVNPNDFAYNMTITGVAKINYEEIADTQSYVGAFMNGECVGVARFTYNSATDRYYAYLMVYSNSVSGDSVEFQVFNAADNQIYQIPRRIYFVADSNLGTIDKPYVWSFPELSNEARFLSFSIPGQIDSTRFIGDSILLTMPLGVELDSLIAEFTVPPMTTVLVGNQIQLSGQTVNDFTKPVVYHLISADETTEAFYTVFVDQLSDFSNQVKASNFFSPNGDGINDYWILKDSYLYKDCEIYVFNRYGKVVYHSKGYNNDWDGTYNGKPLPIDTYMFVIKCPYCKDCVYRGTVTIIR